VSPGCGHPRWDARSSKISNEFLELRWIAGPEKESRNSTKKVSIDQTCKKVSRDTRWFPSGISGLKPLDDALQRGGLTLRHKSAINGSSDLMGGVIMTVNFDNVVFGSAGILPVELESFSVE